MLKDAQRGGRFDLWPSLDVVSAHINPNHGLGVLRESMYDPGNSGQMKGSDSIRSS